MNTVKLTTMFGESNLNYKKFRPGYPKELFDVILSNIERPYHKAIDIGAGTGISTYVSSFIKTLSSPQDYLDEISRKLHEVSNNEMMNVDFSLELALADKK